MSAKAHILVVHDLPCIRTSVVLSLESAGYAVSSADAIPQAFALMDNSPCDLLITDFQVDKGNCCRFVEELRSREPSLPILLLVGTRCKNEIRKLQHIPSLQVLQKPLTREPLLLTVRAMLSIESDSPPSPKVQ